jgi:hypothetical protein
MSWLSVKDNPPTMTNDGSQRFVSARVLIKVDGIVYIGTRFTFDEDEADVTWATDGGFTVKPQLWQPLPL